MTDQHQVVPAHPQARPAQYNGSGDGGQQQRRFDEESTSPRDVWNSVQRNKWLILLCIVLVVGGVGVFTQLVTPIYQAQVSILIDDKSGPTKPVGMNADLLFGPTGQINTQVEVLKSRKLAGDVARALNLQLDVIVPQRTPRAALLTDIAVDTLAAPRNWILSKASGDTFVVRVLETQKEIGHATAGTPFAKDSVTFTLTDAAMAKPEIRIRVLAFRSAVERERKALTVKRLNREANIVVLRAQGSDPRIARDIANYSAQRYITLRTVVQTTEARSTAKFLRHQLDTLAVQLAEAENRLKVFRESNQVVSLEAEAQSDVARLATLRAQRDEIETQRQDLSHSLAEIRDAVAVAKPGDPSPYRRLLASPTLASNAAQVQNFASLVHYDDLRADLMLRRTAEDPEMVGVTQHLKDIEERIGSFAATYLEGLDRQAASLNVILNRFGKSVEKIPSKEIEFARLRRQPKVLEDIYVAMQQRLKETEIAEAVEDPSVRIVDEAILPELPIKPQKQLNLAIGMFFGVILGLSAGFLRDRLDQAVHTREDVQLSTGVPVLGFIPSIQTDGTRAFSWLPRRRRRKTPGVDRPLGTALASMRDPRLVTHIDPRDPVSEAYRGMRTNIMFARPDQPARSLVFTSPMPGDGKTTSVANLAVILAESNLKVLLVDADLRRGVLHEVFGLNREPGLSNVLLNPADLDNTIRRVEFGTHGFDFLPTGPIPPNPVGLLASTRFKELLTRFHAQYDMVIFDSPPLNLVTDAAVLGSQVDGVLLVARAGVTTAAALEFAMEQLRNVRAPTLGTVLNDIDFMRDVRYYSSYGSYGYSYYEYYYGHNKKL